MSCPRYKRAISWLKLQNSLVYLLCVRQIAVKSLQNSQHKQLSAAKLRFTSLCTVNYFASSCDFNETLMTKGQPWPSSSAV